MHTRLGWVIPVLGLALLCVSSSVRAADLSEEEAKKVEAAVKQLENSETRSAGESELRGMGPKVIPALSKAKVSSEEGQLRLRTILVDMAVDKSKIDEGDATQLMQIGREEALAKRYTPAERCYRRANKIYEKLKDDAGDRKDRVKEAEYRELKRKADERADRADNLAKGRTHTGLNLGFVKIGVDRDTREDDW